MITGRKENLPTILCLELFCCFLMLCMTYHALLYAYIILACQTTFLYIRFVIDNLAGFYSCSQYFQLGETHTFWMFKCTSCTNLQFTLGNKEGNSLQSFSCMCVAVYSEPLVHLDDNLLGPEQYLMLQSFCFKAKRHMKRVWKLQPDSNKKTFFSRNLNKKMYLLCGDNGWKGRFWKICWQTTELSYHLAFNIDYVVLGLTWVWLRTISLPSDMWLKYWCWYNGRQHWKQLLYHLITALIQYLDLPYLSEDKKAVTEFLMKNFLFNYY